MKAPRDQVFQTFADSEAWPKFSTFFMRVTVKERAGNTARFDTQVRVMSRKTKRSEKQVLTPPEQVRFEGEMRGSTNTTVWKFEPIPDVTRLTAVLDVQLKGWAKVLGPLAKRQLQGLLRKEMQAASKYIEAK